MSDLTSLQKLGPAPILLEYEYDPGEPANNDVESRSAGPGTEASVVVTRALINDEWIDIEGLLSAAVVAEWEENILKEQQEDAAADSPDEQSGYEVDAAGTYKGDAP